MEGDGATADRGRSRPAAGDPAYGKVVSETVNTIMKGIELVKKGEFDVETLKTIDGMSVQLRAGEFLDLTEVFPFELFFSIARNTKGPLRAYALVIFCFYAMSEAFPINAFASPENCSFLLEILRKAKAKLFSSVLRFSGRLVRAAPDARDWFLANGVLDVLTRYPHTPRIPTFLEALILTEPIPNLEIIMAIHRLYVILSESDNESVIANVLASTTAICKSGIPFDFEFVMAKLNSYAELDDQQVLVKLMEFVSVCPDVPITFARTFVDKLTKLRNWALLQPMLELFISRCADWKGFVDDELIESVLILSDQANFAELKIIAHVLLLYFDFSRVFDERVVRLIISFLSDDTLAYLCFEQLMVIIDNTLEERCLLLSILEDSFQDITNIIEHNSELAEIASAFLQKLDQLKSV